MYFWIALTLSTIERIPFKNMYVWDPVAVVTCNCIKCLIIAAWSPRDVSFFTKYKRAAHVLLEVEIIFFNALNFFCQRLNVVGDLF